MQSFAYKVKSELCRQPVSRQCCARAEAYGVLLFCNTFTAAEVRIITENPEFAARLPRLFQRAFSLKFDSLPDGTRDKLIFRITQRHKLARIVDLLGYDPSLVLHVNFGLLEDDCCRTAFVRGAFLAGGSVTDPEKRYHLELATSHTQASREASALLTEMGFLPHSVRRSGSSVIYFKQSEHIEDLLTTIGAPAAAMDIMTAKVDKEIRNGANRAMNCDSANLQKQMNASDEQLRAIERLAKQDGLKSLQGNVAHHCPHLCPSHRHTFKLCVGFIRNGKQGIFNHLCSDLALRCIFLDGALRNAHILLNGSGNTGGTVKDRV